MIMSTYAGKQIDFDRIKPSDFTIKDISHALSMMCRFNGHISKFYSVAEHSVRASKHAPKEIALATLLHDASEAYMSDVIKPLKNHLPDYEKIEAIIMEAIAEQFGFQWPLPAAVKEIDARMLVTEQRDLREFLKERSFNRLHPYPELIIPWTQHKAELQFLFRFNELTRKK